MRVVFMGTPAFAVPSLRELARTHEVTLVLTRPDAVRGRGRKPVASPVKAAALELGLPVVETKRITSEVLAQIRAARPDAIAVAAFGCILPDELLDVAPLGCVNVHGSLLPRWRGAAPIQRAVLAGDERVGISIMRVVHELDAGAYCRQASVARADQTCPQLMDSLAQLGARELVGALDEIAAGTVTWVEQDSAQVTYAPKIDKAEMHLDPAVGARENRRRVQASLDEAPSRLLVGDKGVRALDACGTDVPVAEGRVFVRTGHVYVGCADGALELTRVKPDGKREMDASAWASGLRDVTSWGVA